MVNVIHGEKQEKKVNHTILINRIRLILKCPDREPKLANSHIKIIRRCFISLFTRPWTMAMDILGINILLI